MSHIDTQLEVRTKKSLRELMKVKERMASSIGEKGGRVCHMETKIKRYEVVLF